MSRTKVVTILPTRSERQFQAELIKFAHLCSWRVAHFRPARLLDKDGKERWRTPVAADGAGWPDLVLVRPPHIYFVECKRDGAKLTPDQQVWIEWLQGCQSSGYVQVFVWHPSDWPEIERLLGGNPTYQCDKPSILEREEGQDLTGDYSTQFPFPNAHPPEKGE